MAHPRSRFRTAGPRRQTTWVGPADQSYQAVASTNKVLIATFDPAANGLTKPTLIRTRGEVAYFNTTEGADSEIVGAYGVGVVSDQAVAAGIASIPGPWSAPEWDGWHVWRSFHYVFQFLDSTGTRQSVLRQEVDSKSMRKITDNETLVLVAESETGAFDISMALRHLFKLA